jgi:hypothetical protein
MHPTLNSSLDKLLCKLVTCFWYSVSSTIYYGNLIRNSGNSAVVSIVGLDIINGKYSRIL